MAQESPSAVLQILERDYGKTFKVDRFMITWMFAYLRSYREPTGHIDSVSVLQTLEKEHSNVFPASQVVTLWLFDYAQKCVEAVPALNQKDGEPPQDAIRESLCFSPERKLITRWPLLRKQLEARLHESICDEMIQNLLQQIDTLRRKYSNHHFHLDCTANFVSNLETCDWSYLATIRVGIWPRTA